MKIGRFPHVALGAVAALVMSVSAFATVAPTDFAKKMTLTPSATAIAKIGTETYANFPVLVRLPAEVSELLRSADGTDLYVEDENKVPLAFEVESFDSSGTTFVWVKVPSLSSATELTVYFGGSANIDNDPTAVWSRYVGVWHFDDAAAGTTTVVDATGHGLDGTTTGTISTYAGPLGGDALQCTARINAPDYDSRLSNVAQFSISGWFKAPSYAGGSGKYHCFASKKDNLAWNADKGWYLEMAQGKTQANLVLDNSNTFTIPDATTNWNYFHLVSDGSTVKVYMNGSTTASKSVSYNVKSSSKVFMICGVAGCSDEYRLRDGATSAAEAALEYTTMADAEFFNAGAIESFDPTEQKFAKPTAVRNANGTYTVSVVLTANNGDVGVIYEAGAAAITNVIQAAATPGAYTDTPANLADDTTYRFSAYGKNANGTEVVRKGGALYNGDISVTTISDANEAGLMPGVFRISRADAAQDLTVAYTVGGTAIRDQSYIALSGTATIPAGATYVDVIVTPLNDPTVTEDVTVSISLASGLYGVSASAGTATMTITNLVAPAGYNTWVAPTDGLASVGSNWSAGVVPTASDNILFDGRFSTAACTWDAAAPHAVGTWTQNADYTNSVIFKTTFSEVDSVFTEFTIAGDATIAGGKWTLPTATADQTARLYRIKVSVGGTLSIANGAAINVSGKAPWSTESGGSYGGQCDFSPAYGNVLEPAEPGQSHKTPGGASGENAHPAFGGGAVWLEVAGATTLYGSIVANGVIHWGWDAYCGSGGGIYLKTASLSGSGTISADGNSTGGSNGGNASAGGRISILLTDASEMTLPLANVHALGSSEYAHQGGAGTVVIRTTSLANGRLIVRNLPSYGQYKYYPTKERTTPIVAGETWTFDEIVFGANGVLRVPEGTTLSLPNGLASISGSSALSAERTSCGILLDGGTLDIADTAATEHVVGSGQWMLSPNAPLVLNGNLTVQGGAAVGAIHIRNAATNSFNKMDLTVKGDMTVASDGYILTEGAGLNGTDEATLYAGTTYGSHGGAFGASSDTAAPSDVVYDSILSPSLPGNRSNAIQRYSSGVAFLTVEGALVLNGTASANAVSAHWGGGAGAINIVAGSLSGSGKITANGNEGGNWDADNNYHLYPGGGRVSVRLTDANAEFSDYWTTNILARGVAWNAGDGTRLHHSTAGTVYLQDGKQKEGAGVVRIFQNNATVNWTTVCTNDFTAFPSTRHGGESDDLRSVALEIGGGAHVLVTRRAKIGSIEMDEHSTINLFGRSLAVKRAKLGENKLAPGRYAASSSAVAGFVVDTAEGAGGELVVTGGGFKVTVK